MLEEETVIAELESLGKARLKKNVYEQWSQRTCLWL